MNWMVPERRLDEYQLSVLQSCGNLNGSTQWIQGFAGSGKSVLLVHLVQRCLTEDPNLSICVAAFTHALKDLLYTGLAEHFRVSIKVMTYHSFLADKIKYDIVAVDEIQDIPGGDIQKIKRLAGYMVVAGDNDQSIYQGSTVEQIQAVLNPNIHRLVTIYRLTQKIKDIVQTILPNSQIENAPSARMQEVEITLAKAETKDEEIKWVWEKCCQYAQVGDPTVILLPNHREIQNFIRKICEIKGVDLPTFSDFGGRSYKPTNELFEKSGIDLRFLGNNFGELSESDNHALTYIMTYHSAKGLDFLNVFLPHLDRGKKFFNDPEIEPRLFFVAMTRSRRNLFLSHSSDVPTDYVEEFPQDLLHKISCNADLAKQPHLSIPDEDVNHIREEFIENIAEVFESNTEIRGEVITAIIERLLNDEMMEKLIGQYQKEQSLQSILSKIEDSIDGKEAKDVYNQIGSTIKDILSDENNDNKPYIPF